MKNVHCIAISSSLVQVLTLFSRFNHFTVKNQEHLHCHLEEWNRAQEGHLRNCLSGHPHPHCPLSPFYYYSVQLREHADFIIMQCRVPGVSKVSLLISETLSI
jgi:hypothetical protein